MWVFFCKKPKKYMDRRMPIGCVYGRDDTSPFMCELYRTSESETRLCTLLLERLDMNRGWVTSYECNATTVAIMKEVMKQGVKTIKTNERNSKRNPLAYVRNKNAQNITANTYCSRMPREKFAPAPLYSYEKAKESRLASIYSLLAK